VACFLIAIALALAVIFLKDRAELPIRRSSWRFSLIIIFGAIMAYCFVLMSFGAPTSGACKTRIWFLELGFVLVFGSLVLKLYRVHVIFHASLSSARFMKGGFPDGRLLIYLSGLIAIAFGLLLGWTLGPDEAGAVIYEVDIAGYGPAKHLRCGFGNIVPLGLIFAFDALIVCCGCLLCLMIREVPSEFNEIKFMFYSLVSLLLVSVVLVPLVFWFPDPAYSNIMSVAGVMIATSVSLWVFCLPKLAQIYFPTIAPGIEMAARAGGPSNSASIVQSQEDK